MAWIIIPLAAATSSLSPPALRYLNAPKRKYSITKIVAIENIVGTNLNVPSPKLAIFPNPKHLLISIGPLPGRQSATGLVPVILLIGSEVGIGVDGGGDGVGAMVGAIVGRGVGSGVGRGVGRGVGIGVGTGVGTGVGLIQLKLDPVVAEEQLEELQAWTHH